MFTWILRIQKKILGIWGKQRSCIIALESHPFPEYQPYFPLVTNDRVGEGVFFGGTVRVGEHEIIDIATVQDSEQKSQHCKFFPTRI